MKSKIFILLAIGILMLSAADVNAQVKGGSFSVTPLAGYSMFKSTSLFEDAATYGIAVGYNFSERFALEATYNVFDTETIPEGLVIGGGPSGPPPPPGVPAPPASEPEQVVPGGADVDAYQYGLEMIVYMYPGIKFAPYGVIGIGQTQIEYPYRDYTTSIEELNCPMGFGFKYFVTDMIAIKGDVRGVFPFAQNNMRATLGISFQLGGK